MIRLASTLLILNAAASGTCPAVCPVEPPRCYPNATDLQVASVSQPVLNQPSPPVLNQPALNANSQIKPKHRPCKEPNTNGQVAGPLFLGATLLAGFAVLANQDLANDRRRARKGF